MWPKRNGGAENLEACIYIGGGLPASIFAAVQQAALKRRASRSIWASSTRIGAAPIPSGCGRRKLACAFHRRSPVAGSRREGSARHPSIPLPHHAPLPARLPPPPSHHTK